MMKLILQMILFLLSSELLAQGQKFNNLADYAFNKLVKSERTQDGIFLKGRDCKVLKKEAIAISIWAKKSDQMSSLDCTCKGDECSLELTSISPEILKKNQSVCMLKDGPNCWNASLRSAGLTDSLRYTTSEEMNFWMESPLCTERLPGEPPSPGDVIAIRDTKDDTKEVHGFTYLSENLSFSKNGFSKKSPYSLQNPLYVYKVYQVPGKCQGIYGAPTDDIKECRYYSNIFSCISFEEYLLGKSLKNEEQKDLIEGIKDIECNLSEIIGSENVVNSEIGKLMLATMSSIKNLATTKEKESQNSDEEFIWKIIKIRSDAVIEQISFL